MTGVEQRWSIPPDPRFVETEYVVDATSNEQHMFWYKWSQLHHVPWREESLGMHTAIGRVTDRPIAVCVGWAFIATKRVAFVEATSQLVDYQMVESWQRAVFPCLSKSGRHSDATNFGHVISGISTMVGFDIIGRGFDELDKLIGAEPR